MLTPSRTTTAGFTLVEVMVAMVILSVAVLGLAASSSKLTTTAVTAETRAVAVHLADDRIVQVRLDPRYGGLDTLYSGVETDILGPGSRRTTTVVHIQETNPMVLDYKVISVQVTARFIDPISRQVVVAAP